MAPEKKSQVVFNFGGVLDPSATAGVLFGEKLATGVGVKGRRTATRKTRKDGDLKLTSPLALGTQRTQPSTSSQLHCELAAQRVDGRGGVESLGPPCGVSPIQSRWGKSSVLRWTLCFPRSGMRFGEVGSEDTDPLWHEAEGWPDSDVPESNCCEVPT